MSSLQDLHPLALPEFIAARKDEGGVCATLAEELEGQLQGSQRFGPASVDVTMAVRYCANALAYTLSRGHELVAAPPASDTLEFGLLLARNLRDAAHLFRELREDDDGLGSATFSEILRGLASHELFAGLDPAEDPRTDPLAVFAEYSVDFPRAIAIVGYHAGYVAQSCAQLSVRERSLFLTRQNKVVALLRGIYPMVVEQQFFLARCLLELGAEADFPAAADRAQEMSRLFFKAVGGHLSARPHLYDGIVKQLTRLLDAVEQRSRQEHGLAVHLAAIETQRFGMGHADALAAHARMARHP